MLETIAGFCLAFAVLSFLGFVVLFFIEQRAEAQSVRAATTRGLADTVDIDKLTKLLAALADALKAVQALGPKALALLAALAFMGLAIYAATPPGCPDGMVCTKKPKDAAKPAP